MTAMFLLAILILLAGPVLGIIALSKASDLERKLRKLQAAFDMLQSGGVASRVAPETVSPVATKKTPSKKPAMAAKAEPAPALADVVADVVAEVPEAPVAPVITAPVPAVAKSVEGTLASKWFVWVGGAAVGLGGLLFVKYAHDNGLIPPVLRVVIGLGVAAGLVFAGEKVRTTRGEGVKDHVPAALSAAGLIIAFGVIYAAYALYELLSPGVCFPLLVAVGLGALWLSRRQGPVIAALGLIGSFAAPALVPSDNPNIIGFFAYLAVIVAASLYELRGRSWWWLGYAAIAGASAWALLWLNGYGPGNGLVVGLFALAMAAGAVLVPRGLGILAEDMGSLAKPDSLSAPMKLAIAGIVAGVVVHANLVGTSSYAVLPLAYFAIAMAAVTLFGWLRQGLVAAPLLAGAATLALLLAWPDVGFHEWAMDENGLWSTVPGMIEPPRFLRAMGLAGLAFVVAGLFGAWQKVEQRPWAALAAGSAVLFLFGAWARADFALSGITWAIVALVLAGGLSFAAWRSRAVDEKGTIQSVQMLLAGVALLDLFAIDRLLDSVWQTLAIAFLAAAYAWCTRLFSKAELGAAASALAGLAAVRLFVGREFWGEPAGLPLGAHWVLYGYGVPAVLFWLASRWVEGRWRVALEGVALGLGISLVSLELRVLIGGGITTDHMGLLELSSHALAWMGAAYGLAYRQGLFSSFVSLWGARVLLAASCVALLGGLTVHNPVVTGDAVQGGTIINSLWLAYLAPVPLIGLLARKLDGLGLGRFRNGLGVFALALLMMFMTLAVKRWFQDATLDGSFLSDAESYTTSAVWIVVALGIFMAGLKLDRQNIRYGGLAILVMSILKVFALDLFELGGLWRIASIIGLGLCLIGVGWLYTRFMQNKGRADVAA